MEHGLCYLAAKSIHRQNSPMHDSGVEKNPGGCAQAETTEPRRSLSYSGGDRSGSHLWGTGRAIAFGIFLTSELRKKPESVYFRLLPVLIGWYMALKMAVSATPIRPMPPKSPSRPAICAWEIQMRLPWRARAVGLSARSLLNGMLERVDWYLPAIGVMEFLEQDLKTPLPCRLHFKSSDRVIELVSGAAELEIR